MTYKIITDKKKLSAHVTATITSYGKTFQDLHVAVVSAIASASRHGNPAELNRIYDALNSNDQTALKFYVKRIQVVNGLELSKHPSDALEGIPQEVASEMHLKGAVLGFAKGAFSVINGHLTEQAKSLLVLCDKRFINPDGEIDRMVFERNNFAETKTFGDKDMLKKLIKLAKETEQETDTRKIEMSPSIKKFFQEMKDLASVRLNQLTLNEG